MTHTCPTCMEEFAGLSQHLALLPSHRPELSEAQLDAIRFLLLSGCERRTRNRSHPSLVTYSRNDGFLGVLREQLGWAANDVHVYRSAESVADRLDRIGVDVEPEECRSVHGLATRPLPKLEELEGPSDVETLTPRLLSWIIAACGRYLATPPFEVLHLNTNDLAVDAEHLRWLLREHGIEVGAPTNDEFHVEATEEGVIAIPTVGLISIREEFQISIEPKEDDRAHVVENTTTIEEAITDSNSPHP